MGRWFYRLRVAFLLAVLGIVALYAWHDRATRRERNEWRRTLDVALVVLTAPGVDQGSVDALRRRVPDLSRRLADELLRYKPGAPRPFDFTLYGPTELTEAPPEPGAESLTEAARYAWRLYQFTRDTDRRAGVPSRGFDSRIYLLVTPPSARAVVEGMSEHGGRVGVARTELDAESVDLALFVTAHELFHTLGALDHYGPDGRALFPDGLAEPDLVPQLPQRFAELMARNRPVSATSEERLTTLDELGVGPATAREIGWLTPTVK
jgi:hypothetical protein